MNLLFAIKDAMNLWPFRAHTYHGLTGLALQAGDFNCHIKAQKSPYTKHDIAHVAIGRPPARLFNVFDVQRASDQTFVIKTETKL